MDKMRRLVVRILKISVSVLFMAITGITLAQVFCRYALGFSLTWSHELVVLFFIWTVWLCIPIGLDTNSHIAMTILKDRVSGPARRRLSLVIFISTLIFFALLFFLTFPVLASFEGMFLTTIPVSIQVHYFAMIVGSLASIFILIARGRPKQGRG